MLVGTKRMAQLEGFEREQQCSPNLLCRCFCFRPAASTIILTIFGDGNPGTEDKPNYRELFQYYNENCSEIIFSITYGGPFLGVKVCCGLVPVPPVMHNAGLCLLSAWQTVTNQLVTGDFCDELIFV